MVFGFFTLQLWPSNWQIEAMKSNVIYEVNTLFLRLWVCATWNKIFQIKCLISLHCLLRDFGLETFLDQSPLISKCDRKESAEQEAKKSCSSVFDGNMSLCCSVLFINSTVHLFTVAWYKIITIFRNIEGKKEVVDQEKANVMSFLML